MSSDGLWAWGAKLRTLARARLFVVSAVLALGCGSGEGHKRAVECNTDDDCDTSTLGACDTVTCDQNRCELGTRPDGHRCDDSDPLTGDDACLSGICAGTVKDCTMDLGPCLMAVHDPMTDECTVEPVDDGTPCDDADACTRVDSCQAGECVGAKPVSCKATDDCHVVGECDPKTGECSDVKADDGAPCDDGQACTTDDACRDGACAGQAVACDDGLACSVDSCDEKSGACAADMSACSCVKDADCDDGDACNGQETCGADDKLCKSGAPVVCAASTDPCLSNVCVPETGACQADPVKDGVACDDADACTTTDTCQSGACVGSGAVVCTALSQCHVAGVCDKVTGACTNPEKAKNSVCSDGNACTVADTCQAGQCVGGAPVACTASDQCHDAGVCDAATGVCSKPAKQNGATCSDANPCTNGDACQAGVCTLASQVTCAASDSCHSAGSCDVKTGLCSNPAKADGATCNDGLTCTGPDVCTAGKCSGKATTCDDGIACTVDSCSEKLGGCTVNSSACACKTSADCNDNNPCNGVETCNLKTLQCQSGTAVDCSTLNDACNAGSCDVTTGACVAAPKANGIACDDGDKCTQASSCQAGVCQGQNPITCAASDQCHDAGTCNPGTGVCSNPAKSNGSSCNDGNACTKTDSCQSGVCTGSSAVVCSASDQCHTAGACDTSTGLCSNPAKKNGATCDDGSLCTQTDTCQGGVCAGASPITCSASDQCHSAGTCDGKTGTCSNPTKTDGSGCDDGNLCTQTDTCQKGACTGTKPVTCAASDQCHTAGTCATATGACSNPSKKDGTVCDDGSACTKTDTCVTGVCTGASPVTCTASDQCHDAGTCAAATGTCSNPTKADNTPCNDSLACTGGDKCTKGACGGATVTCDDKIACTVDSCAEPTGCNFDRSKCGCAKDADCNDNNACNGVETCDLTTLSCKAGTAVSCTALDDPCNLGTCDTKTGACAAVARADGTACDDGSACTKSDGCVAGKCVGKSPVTCSASDQCHAVGSCDSKTGVCSNPNKPDNTSCDDGNKCTQTDTCQTGVCQGGNAVTCTASDQCHSAGTCALATGACSNPVKTGACDDGDKCTQNDSCQAGVCTGANPVVCSASDQCHDVGTCDKTKGTCSNPAKTAGTACDDGNSCTQSDSCQAGACTGSKPVTCKALGQCYSVGTCDTQTGLCSNPFAGVGAKCDDADACTTGETCNGQGVCSGGSAVTCQPPANLCQTNICNSSLGCVGGVQPSGTACDDGSFCTQTDQCNSTGACIGGNPLDNTAGDWADDPGNRSAGPTSVDIFADAKNNADITGTYLGGIYFNDKDAPKTATLLALPATQETGIYWAVYNRIGTVLRVANLGGVQAGGTLTVDDVAGHTDGSFTLLGTVMGAAVFGLPGATQALSAKTLEGFVAHYAANGAIQWVAEVLPGNQVPFGTASVAAYDDGSVIAIGSVGGVLSVRDAAGKTQAVNDRAGVWAARFDPNGNGQWAELVVFPSSTYAARAVTTHEDGGASLTGVFAGTATLGPKGSVAVSVSANEQRGGRDIWFQKLDKSGAIVWGGRVGGPSGDVAGDVARIKGGGTLLLANTLGAPNADDSKTTQQLHFTAATGLQAHVIGIGADGVMVSDALIANDAGGAHGWQLQRDSQGLYAVGGTFTTSTNFWSSVGFGAGAPPANANYTIASLYQGPDTLFAARVDEASKFGWAIQAGGDNSGMLSLGRDVVMAAHPNHSVTIAGIFDTEAYFGDKVPELLDPEAGTLGNPYVVHLNSEAAYDYCP